MPELPEVETIRLGLQPRLKGQTIKSVKVLWAKSFPDARQLKSGTKVAGIERRGKVLIIRLSNKSSLLVHLKMTGQLVLVQNAGKRFGGGHPTKSMAANLPDLSTRAIFEFKAGDKLFFNDQRKFGWIKLVPNEEVNKDALLARLGPEPLSNQFLLADFHRAIQKRASPIKAVLLDQSVVAGLGNIYVDEALHLAKIHPIKTARQLNIEQTKRLHKAIIKVLSLSVKHGGTSFTNYVNALGLRGDYLQHARVFNRTGLPCPLCKTPIKKIRVAGRGTHVCTTCQKPPRAKIAQ